MNIFYRKSKKECGKMDMKIINEILDIRETIFEGSPEQGFECDILLPDYCPDVRRILKCHVSPKVSQGYQNGDKVVRLDGPVSFFQVFHMVRIISYSWFAIRGSWFACQP